MDRMQLYAVIYAETLAACAGLSIKQLSTPSRKKELVEPRQMIMHILRQEKVKLKTIGSIFGGRDHTTVVHAEQTVANHLKLYDDYRDRYNKLKGVQHG